MKNGVNQILREGRKAAGLTQQQLSMELFKSRESIRDEEIGACRVQPYTANYFAEKHNNPWVALEASAEYTSWGPVKLDGEAADLHRTTVTVKTIEELEEALAAMIEASRKLTINPHAIDEVDIKIIEKSLSESIDAITALNHYVAVVCKEYGISWMKMWTQHKLKLISRRFLKK